MNEHTTAPVTAIVGVTVGLVVLLYGVGTGNQMPLQLIGGTVTVASVFLLAAYLARVRPART